MRGALALWRSRELCAYRLGSVSIGFVLEVVKDRLDVGVHDGERCEGLAAQQAPSRVESRMRFAKVAMGRVSRRMDLVRSRVGCINE